jgi:hypothetical protein
VAIYPSASVEVLRIKLAAKFALLAVATIAGSETVEAFAVVVVAIYQCQASVPVTSEPVTGAPTRMTLAHVTKASVMNLSLASPLVIELEVAEAVEGVMLIAATFALLKVEPAGEPTATKACG